MFRQNAFDLFSSPSLISTIQKPIHNIGVALGSGIDSACKNAASPVALRLGGRKCWVV